MTNTQGEPQALKLLKLFQALIRQDGLRTIHDIAEEVEKGFDKIMGHAPFHSQICIQDPDSLTKSSSASTSALNFVS
jgi:hypothetical protein